jgi:hypothetical protein
MHVRRGILRGSVRLATGVALACIGAALLPTGAMSADPVKRARPPKFSQDVVDAFFLDANARLVGPPPGRSAPVAGKGNPQTPGIADQPEGSWAEVISAEALEDEIKNCQIALSEATRSPAKFKSAGFQAAREYLNLSAALFGIVAHYGKPVRWQRDALPMRSLAARAGAACRVGTDATYADAKAVAVKLEALVRGESGQGREPDSPKALVPERAMLMKRLERASEESLPSAATSPTEQARNAQLVAHEAQIIEALARVIGQAEYEFADDETYREYASAMAEAARTMRAAVARSDYPETRAAVAKIGKACADCHEGFRN